MIFVRSCFFSPLQKRASVCRHLKTISSRCPGFAKETTALKYCSIYWTERKTPFCIWAFVRLRCSSDSQRPSVLLLECLMSSLGLLEGCLFSVALKMSQERQQMRMLPRTPQACPAQIVWLQPVVNECVPTGWLHEWGASGLILLAKQISECFFLSFPPIYARDRSHVSASISLDLNSCNDWFEIHFLSSSFKYVW